MNTNSTESLRKFISDNQLKRVDGNILFSASVNFYSENSLHTVHSEVQVILLINEIAVYVLEFLKDEYDITEMYSSGYYHFSCPNPQVLEIRRNETDTGFILSITPV